MSEEGKMKPRRLQSDTSASMRLAGAGGVDIGGREIAGRAAPGQFRALRGRSRGARRTLTPGAARRARWAFTAFLMKLTFTQKEYQRLLELAHLGMWVVTAYQGEETAAAKRYFDLDQKLLELAGPLGCADLVRAAARRHAAAFAETGRGRAGARNPGRFHQRRLLA